MISLINLIRHGQYQEAIISVLASCFVVFICLPIHEMAHGYAAYALGDTTAKSQGRLSFNPLAHLDPIGTLMIFLFGFGYARPVPVNIGRFKNPKKGMALTALAGPTSNIIMASISVFFAYFIAFIARDMIMLPSYLKYIFMFFQYAASINITLAVFNLIPIPPLDGSRVLNAVLPNKQYYGLMKYERYFTLGILLILFTGILDAPIFWLSDGLMSILSFIPKLIFGIS